MAQQVESSANSFCSPQELFDFADPRQIATLLRDDDTINLQTEAEMLINPKLLKLLKSGSGELESACLPRGQYSVADLEAIASSGTNAATYLKRVAAGCTILAAFGRRHSASGAKPEDYLAVAHAREALERLRVGEHVFGLAQNIDAGKGMVSIPFTDTSGADLNRTANIASRFFGNRSRGGW
jgi:hypothetical protein